MELTIERREGLRIVRIDGELDTFGVQTFRDELGQLAAADRFVVDLTSLAFVDSAGLHALFNVSRAAKEVGATVVFVVPAESSVRRVIELVQLADVSPVCDSLELAVARLGEAARLPDRDAG